MQRVAVLHGMSPTVVWKRPTGAHGPYERTSELNAVLRARHKWQSQAVGPGFADEALEGVNQKCFAILALHARDITTEHGLSFQLQVRLAAGATLASRTERQILFLGGEISRRGPPPFAANISASGGSVMSPMSHALTVAGADQLATQRAVRSGNRSQEDRARGLWRRRRVA